MIFGIVYAAVVAVLVVALVRACRPTSRRWRAAQWIAKRDAPITPALRSEIEGALWRERAGMLIGGLIGCLIAIPAAATFDPTQEWTQALTRAAAMLPLMLTFVGAGIGGLVVAYPQVRGPVRVASATAPKLTDSVSPVALFAIRLQMCLMLVGGLAATQYSRWTGTEFGPLQWVLLWGAILVTAVVWVLIEIVTKRLAAAPQPSTDALSLFWRETLRADLLREIWRVPAALGLVVPSLISECLPPSYGTPAQDMGPYLNLWLTIVILVVSCVAQFLLSVEPQSRRRSALLREVQLKIA